MRIFTAVAISVLLSAHGSAQSRPAPSGILGTGLRPASPPIQIPSVGALGGNFGTAGISRPLGGVAPPSFPAPGPRPHLGGGRGGPSAPGRFSRYLGPVYYVPNAWDSTYQTQSDSIFNRPYVPPYLPPAAAQPASPQPIIINQYFGSRSDIAAQPADGGETANPGDPLGPAEKYYLIAYKDHSVYTALAYWLEGDTLHYVTTANRHNQASLDRIDLERTAKLNADANVPFSLAGR